MPDSLTCPHCRNSSPTAEWALEGHKRVPVRTMNNWIYTAERHEGYIFHSAICPVCGKRNEFLDPVELKAYESVEAVYYEVQRCLDFIAKHSDEDAVSFF